MLAAHHTHPLCASSYSCSYSFSVAAAAAAAAANDKFLSLYDTDCVHECPYGYAYIFCNCSQSCYCRASILVVSNNEKLIMFPVE